MRRVLKGALLLLALAAAGGLGWIASGIGIGRAVPVAALAERERAFAERMRGAVLDGRFTVNRPEPREGTRADRYEIARAVKLDGDRWRFDARITYGGVDVTLPVVVPVLWAGEVPMIRLVEAEIPGLGSEFGATILFDGDRYAGTWDHGEVGGFMFGTIAPREPGTAGSSPAEQGRVASEDLVGGHHGHSTRDRLSDQPAIERVVVVAGEERVVTGCDLVEGERPDAQPFAAACDIPAR